MRHVFISIVSVCLLIGCSVAAPPTENLPEHESWKGDPCELWSLFYSGAPARDYTANCPHNTPFTQDRRVFCDQIRSIDTLPSGLQAMLCEPNPCKKIREFMCAHALSDQALSAPESLQKLSCPESDDFCTCTEEELGSQEKDIVDTLAVMCQKNTRP